MVIMQNSDNTLNLKQALLELLKVVKKNHYTKDENDSKLSLKVDDIIYQVDKNNLESEIKNLELSDEQIIGIINNEIKTLIPNQASSTNQLADKDFVNSSISTATATFRGTYTSKSDFPLINVDINDYLWYDTTDSLGNRKFDKYKYSNGEWVYEYTLNNSSFTEEQWKAINSSATIELINKISINEENINNLNNNKLEKETFNSFKLENNEALNTKVDKIEGKGLSTNDFTNELKEKLNGIEANAQVNTITGVKGDNEVDYRVGNVSISKENIGLGNVDNTSDMDKPISTATQQALDLKADKKDVSEVDIDLEGTGTIVSIPENATGYGTIEKLGGKSIVNYGSTSGYGLLPSEYFDNRMGIIVDIPSGTYSLYLKQSVNCYYGYIDSNGTHNLGNTHNSNYVASDTFTFNESLKFVIWYDAGFTGSNASEVFNLVLNGDAPTNQLPYGLNVYYPTNVNVVTGNICNYDEFLANQYTIANDGSYTSDNTRGCTNYLEVKSNEYKVSFDTQVVFISVAYYDENKTYMSRSIANDSKELNLSIPSNAKYLRFSFQYQYATPLSTTILNNIKPILSYVSQNLPQTNIINFVSTQLQTNHSWTQENASKWLGLGVGNDSNIIDYANNKKGIVKYSIIDMGTLSFTYNSSANTFTTNINDIKQNTTNTQMPNILSTKFNPIVWSGGVWVDGSTCGMLANQSVIHFYDTSYGTDATAFKNAMSGVMLIYELATPIEIDLSSLETEEHFECESNGSIIHDTIANYKYSFPVSLKGQVELNFEHDKEQQRDIDSLKKEIETLKQIIATLTSSSNEN